MLTEGGEYKLFKGNNFKADGYDKTTNTVYEFHGCYWHGCPKCHTNRDDIAFASNTYRELYEKTIQKEQKIRDSGYNLIVMWECEFKKYCKDKKLDILALKEELRI